MRINIIQNYNYNSIKQNNLKICKTDSSNVAQNDCKIYNINKNNEISFGNSKAINMLYYQFNKPAIPFEHIAKWVNQFEPNERKLAIKLAGTIDYLSYPDTISELQSLHKKLFAQLQKGGFDTNMLTDIDFTKAYVCKSGDIVSYLYRKANKVRNCSFKTMESLITNNPENIENRAIVILDDYTGSGEQFLYEFYSRNNDNCNLLNKYKKIYFVPMVANNIAIQNFNAISNGEFDKVAERFMQSGLLRQTDEDIYNTLRKIETSKLEIIEGKVEYPLLSKENDKLTNIEKDDIKKFLLKYECGYPFGYGNVQGHTAFFFTIPNNTPDILSNPKMQNKGIMPLFQRTDDITIYPVSELYDLEDQVR